MSLPDLQGRLIAWCCKVSSSSIVSRVTGDDLKLCFPRYLPQTESWRYTVIVPRQGRLSSFRLNRCNSMKSYSVGKLTIASTRRRYRFRYTRRPWRNSVRQFQAYFAGCKPYLHSAGYHFLLRQNAILFRKTAITYRMLF